MSIICRICNKEFLKQITNSHLKTHNISTADYREKFGELTSSTYKNELSISRTGSNNSNYGKKWTEEGRKNLSEKKQNSTPWNKGLKIGSSENLLKAIEQREEKYKNGSLVRKKGYSLSDERKEKISIGVSNYVINNSEELKARAKKSVETKKKKNYDFGSNMRGKRHKEETKRILSESSTQRSIEKINAAREKRQKYIAEANLSLITEKNKLLELSCNTCGSVFSLTRQCFTKSKFKKEWCQNCYPLKNNFRSDGEIEIYDFVKSLCSDAKHSDRRLLEGKEIDIYIPSKKIAIEYNGLYWHSEQVLEHLNKSKWSDFDKMTQVKNLSVRYIGIFEDEWINKKDIVKSRLRNILNCIPNKIFARKCEIVEISSQQASKFCNENHIQGSGRSNVRYGLFFNGELVSVMTFSKSNLSRKISDWEINRFCNKLDYNIIGAASRLFKKFVLEHNPDKVISYADSRWSEGNLYKVLNFKFEKQTTPNYWYFLPNELTRIHRFSLRKNSDDVQELTEKENRLAQGYNRIWDCGNSKWIWKRESS